MKTNKPKAYRVFVPEFQFYDVHFQYQKPNTNGTLKQRRDFKPIYKTASIFNGYFPDFPVLISGCTKLPWTLGNLYLIRRLQNNPSAYEADTFKSISGSLLDYLRFLESEDLDPLEFHERLRVRRPTYLYRQNLLDRMRAGRLACSTAKQHMNRIIKFYKVLATDNIIGSELLEKVHEARTVLIPVINSEGFRQSLTISTSDLAIKTQPKSADEGYIQDDGSLYPLISKDQEYLVDALKSSERCIFLIFIFALFTGARIQTVGTLRIDALKKSKLNPNGLYQVKVGPGTKIDTKKSKTFTLLVPPRLRNALLVYTDSPTARKRREISWYGLSDENYVFLNRSGDPYFTSKFERKERRNFNHHPKVGIQSSSKHIKPKAGEAIRTYIRETLIPRIRKEHPCFPEFRFHDLRATFGMNLLELKLKEMDDHNIKVREEGRDDFRGTEWVLEQVMQRLGHRSITTTMRYLNYKRKLERRENILHEVENDLMMYVPPSALENLEAIE